MSKEKTILSKTFEASSAGSSAWPAGVTEGAVTLVRDPEAGTFTATLVALAEVPQPLATYTGRLGELPAFLEYVGLIESPGLDQTVPSVNVSVQARNRSAAARVPRPRPGRPERPGRPVRPEEPEEPTDSVGSVPRPRPEPPDDPIG
jgi:hypothetical protein